MQLQNCVFPNFNLQILSSKSNLRSSFTNLFNFKFSKTCWKSPKLYKRSLTHFQKMSLARWFWAFFFEKKSVLSRKMSKNKRFFSNTNIVETCFQFSINPFSISHAAFLYTASVLITNHFRLLGILNFSLCFFCSFRLVLHEMLVDS